MKRSLRQEIIQAKRTLARQYPALKKLFKDYPIELEIAGKVTIAENLIRAIVHQQLSGKAAQTILNRFLDLFPNGRKKFPSAESILQKSPTELHSVGLSKSKTKAIFDIAQFEVAKKIPNQKAIHKLTNEEIIQTLIPIYGVGRWTVEMLLIFSLGRLDVWPVDDFGVRRGYQVWKKLKEIPSPKELHAIGVKWQPYGTIMALTFWRVADAAKVKQKKPAKPVTNQAIMPAKMPRK